MSLDLPLLFIDLSDVDFLRLSMSFLAGTLLALSGSLIQGLTQNELAGSSTLGMDGLFVLMVLISYFSFDEESLELGAFILVALFLFLNMAFFSFLYFRNRKKSMPFLGNQVHLSMNRILLMGLCFNLLIGAIFSVLQFLFITLNQQFPTQIWYGNFRYIAPSAPYSLSFILLFCFFVLVRGSLLSKLRLLSFGKDLALSLGVPVKNVMIQGFLLAFLAVGVVVSYFGVFSFLGLIFPHFLRSFPLFRYNLKKEMLLGAPLCGVLLALLDFLCFNFPIYGMEIPVGMLSAVLGSLGLVIILIRKNKTWET